MKTYSSKTGDRITLRTIDQANGDIVLQDDITIRLEPGAVRPGVDIWGELISESDETTKFLSEIIDEGLQFRFHIDTQKGKKQRSALVCNATGDDPEQLEWTGFR